MKAIFIKVIILIIIVGGVNLIISSFIYKKFTPYYWGNQAITDKRNFIKSNNNYDVIFLGSSKTYHQINPLVFDSAVSIHEEIKSFNYGIQSLLPPESFYILENLLLNDSIHCKYLFMELNWFSNLKMKDLHSRRNYYWLNPGTYTFSLNSTINSNIPLSYKGWSVASRTINLVDKVYNIGIYNEISNYYAKDNDNTSVDSEVLQRYSGFAAVNRDTGITKTMEYEAKLIREIEESKKASEVSFKKYDGIDEKEYHNKVFYDYLKNLISIAEKRGIQLIYVMPPQWKAYQYDELIPLFEHFPEKNKIVLADVRKYPELFEFDNLFDADHLNEKGAKIITKYLAKEFIKLKEKKEPVN